jgi:hypothetical protein
MNQPVALDAVLATSAPERKGDPRLSLVWSFIVVVAIVAIAALISDGSLTPDQRIEMFQSSGIYP